MVMDTSRPSDAKALVELALIQYGSLDVLVNNAGIDAPRVPSGASPTKSGSVPSTSISGSLLLHPRRPQAYAGGGQRLYRQYQLPGRPRRRRPQRLPRLQRQQGRPHRTDHRLVGPGCGQGRARQRHHARTGGIKRFRLVAGGTAAQIKPYPLGIGAPRDIGKPFSTWSARPLDG